MSMAQSRAWVIRVQLRTGPFRRLTLAATGQTIGMHQQHAHPPLRALHKMATVVGVEQARGKGWMILHEVASGYTGKIDRIRGSPSLVLVSRITNQESRIKNHESRITNQESRIKNHESRITNRESRIKNHESRITNRESRIENHESRITNRESRIENHESRITARLAGRVVAVLGWGGCMDY